jgi:hypothetical protein
MFGRSSAGSAAPSGVREKRRGERRGFGPFTGAQATVIVVTFAVLLLFPVGAWAAFTVSHVTITDNGGVNTANVDAGHHLLVGDGTGPLTVDGTVSRRPVPPASPFQFNIDAQIGETFVAGPTPLSTVINVTSLTISIPVNQGQRHIELRAVLQNASATGCAFGGADVTIWHAENLTGNLTASFPTPLQTPKAAGAKMCLSVYNAYGLSNDVPIVSGSGFTGN